MNELLSFSADLRCKSQLLSIIPANMCMGMPYQVKENIIFIPFFKIIEKGKYSASAELLVEYPSGEILRYSKMAQLCTVNCCEDLLIRAKKAFIEENTNSIETYLKDLPSEMKSIYRKAAQNTELEKY